MWLTCFSIFSHNFFESNTVDLRYYIRCSSSWFDQIKTLVIWVIKLSVVCKKGLSHYYSDWSFSSIYLPITPALRCKTLPNFLKYFNTWNTNFADVPSPWNSKDEYDFFLCGNNVELPLVSKQSEDEMLFKRKILLNECKVCRWKYSGSE